MADAVEFTTRAARCSKCDRPTPALRHTSDTSTSGCAVSQSRYRWATSTNAAGVRADRGNTVKRPSAGTSTGPVAAAGSAGASSTMRCAFVPENPNPLIPATRGRSLRAHGTASSTTRTGSRSHGMCGEAFWKFRCFGSSSCSSDRITLISPAIPAAASRCPTFVFTDPIRSGRPASRPAPNAAPAACTSIGSPSDVPVPCASR